jgi:hypothetical protein
MAEIAGLVLGGIPLVISAIEHYRECFKVLGCWTKYTKEYRICFNRMKTFDLDFELLIDKLCGDLVGSEDEWTKLKANGANGAWNDVEAKLKERLLPKVYEAFVKTMGDIHTVMEDLKRELGVYDQTLQEQLTSRGLITNEASSPSESMAAITVSQVRTTVQRTRDRMYYEGQRAKFSLGAARRKELFDSIESYTTKLDSLLTKNDEVAKHWPMLAVPQGLSTLWRHAQNVFRLISLSWLCPCRATHLVDLRLYHRESPAVCFDVCFRSGQPQQGPQLSWRLLETTIEEVKEEVVTAATGRRKRPLASASVSITSSLANKPNKRARIASARSSVSFLVGTGHEQDHRAGPSRSATVTQTQPQPQPPIPLGTPPPSTIPDHIGNLCQAISQHSISTPCTGLLASRPDIDFRYKLNACSTAVHQDSETCSLQTLLCDPTKALNRKQRYAIALAIASSQNQLHSTSWLGQKWSSDDIYFRVVGGVPDVSRPYVRRNFPSTPPTTTATRGHRIDSFGSLGILLLELCFGTPLSKSPFRQKYKSPDGTPDFFMDLAAAQEWADSCMEGVEGETGEGYGDAVLWCLNKRTLTPREKLWRQDLHRAVILPIQSAYQAMTTTTSL